MEVYTYVSMCVWVYTHSICRGLFSLFTHIEDQLCSRVNMCFELGGNSKSIYISVCIYILHIHGSQFFPPLYIYVIYT